MKKFLKYALLSSFVISSHFLVGKVITVNNSDTKIAQYSDLQTAIDNSGLDDTIYVHPSPNPYNGGSQGVNINRRLTIIGGGYAPTETQYGWSTVIPQLNLDSVPSDPISGNKFPISGTKIIGCHISSWLDYYISDYKTDITVERCMIANLQVRGIRYKITNCIIGSIDVNNFSSLVFSNNLVGSVGQSNKSTVIFTNNIFYPRSGAATFGTVSYANFSNNIFYSNNPTPSDYCTFNNNFLVHSVVLPVLPNGTNTGAGNFSNINPQFKAGNLPASIALGDLPKYDWSLVTSSKGIKGGTDGTDIGIYGGAYPMPNLTGASTLPQITRMDLFNSVLPKTDKLKVSFKARKVN